VVDLLRRWCPRPNSKANGRSANGFAGAADVTGAAQADGIVSSRDLPDFHQPDSRENWRDVWQSGNDYWRAPLKFYASMRVDIRRIQAIKKATSGGIAHAREVVKNKVAAPFARRNSTSFMEKGFRARAT